MADLLVFLVLYIWIVLFISKEIRYNQDKKWSQDLDKRSEENYEWKVYGNKSRLTLANNYRIYRKQGIKPTILIYGKEYEK